MSAIVMIRMIWTIFSGSSNQFTCSLNNIYIILMEPIYLDTKFILVLILFLAVYVSLITLVILLRSRIHSRHCTVVQRVIAGQWVRCWLRAAACRVPVLTDRCFLLDFNHTPLSSSKFSTVLYLAYGCLFSIHGRIFCNFFYCECIGCVAVPEVRLFLAPRIFICVTHSCECLLQSSIFYYECLPIFHLSNFETATSEPFTSPEAVCFVWSSPSLRQLSV